MGAIPTLYTGDSVLISGNEFTRFSFIIFLTYSFMELKLQSFFHFKFDKNYRLLVTTCIIGNPLIVANFVYIYYIGTITTINCCTQWFCALV